MKVLTHHIYEYIKGLRNLVLHTMDSKHEELAKAKLEKYQIPYIIQYVNDRKINIFFGAEDCITVVREFVAKRLIDLSPEEDFILGIMLGYDKIKQCQRYMKMKKLQDKTSKRA